MYLTVDRRLKLYVNVLGGLPWLQWLPFVISAFEWTPELSKHATFLILYATHISRRKLFALF